MISKAAAHAFVHVGMTDIETVVQVEVGLGQESSPAARRWRSRWECSPAGSPRRAAGRRAGALRAP